MKYRFLTTIVLALLLAAVPCWGHSPATGSNWEAGWEEQARGMVYLILHLSSINAINGMNLTKDQAVRLLQMAQEVEACSKEIPDFEAAYRPDLAEVRDTYLEVRQYIIHGKEVPGELESRVQRARGIESAVIRLSLSNKQWTRSGCVRCHTEPGTRDVRLDKRTMTSINKTSYAVFTHRERETFLAHMGGVFGKRGALKLISLSEEVDRLLTDGQKEILRTFACCLIPPRGLSDPVRAGQAAGGEKEIEIFRKIRKIPDVFWPYAKARGLKKLEQLLVFKQPGITEEKIKTTCDRVGELYEKVRALSDVDFEMDKDALAADLREAGGSKKELGQRQQRFMNSFFLLIPGSSDVYRNLIKRIDPLPVL